MHESRRAVYPMRHSAFSDFAVIGQVSKVAFHGLLLLVVCAIHIDVGIADRGSQPSPYHHESSESCPPATETARRRLEGLIFPKPNVTPRWLNEDVKVNYIPALGNISGRGDIIELTDAHDHDVCIRLNEMHSMNIAAEFEMPEREEPAYVYEYGYYRAGDFYFAVFNRLPMPQPDDPMIVRSSTRSGFISVYDADLKIIGGFRI